MKICKTESMRIKSYQNYLKTTIRNYKQAELQAYEPIIFRQSYTFPRRATIMLHSPIYDKIDDSILRFKSTQSGILELYSKEITLIKASLSRIVEIFFSNSLKPSEKAEELEMVTKLSTVYLGYKLQRRFSESYNLQPVSERIYSDWSLEDYDITLAKTDNNESTDNMKNGTIIKFTPKCEKLRDMIVVDLKNVHGGYLIDGIDMRGLKLSGYTRSV